MCDSALFLLLHGDGKFLTDLRMSVGPGTLAQCLPEARIPCGRSVYSQWNSEKRGNVTQRLLSTPSPAELLPNYGACFFSFLFNFCFSVSLLCFLCVCACMWVCVALGMEPIVSLVLGKASSTELHSQLLQCPFVSWIPMTLREVTWHLLRVMFKV
jgi:hypothetical protein